MVRVMDARRMVISKQLSSFREGNTMLLFVAARFCFIPLKIQGHAGSKGKLLLGVVDCLLHWSARRALPRAPPQHKGYLALKALAAQHEAPVCRFAYSSD